MAWAIVLVLLLFALWLGLTRAGRQSASVIAVGLSTLPQRLGSSSVIVFGIAGVVGVLVAMLAMAAGFEATLKQSGSDDTAIILRGGSQAELNSVVDHDTTVLINQLPQVQRDAAGQPVATAEVVVVASLPKRSTGLDANVELRGVGSEVWAVRPNVRITAGRRFTPGLRELVVGKRAVDSFAGIALGSTLKLGGQQWTVVGTFESDDAQESDLWGDVEVVAPTYRRGSSRSSDTVRLTSASAFDAFKAGIDSDPRLKLDVTTTREYYTAQSRVITKILSVIGVTVSAIMAVGAIFGALNSMYAAVSTRTREIATLRAIGFRGWPVLLSVMVETMLLALLGGIIGAALAWVVFDHYTASSLGANFTQVVFSFRVTPRLLMMGLVWALAIGFVGGFFPALRAARMPVISGLREL